MIHPAQTERMFGIKELFSITNWHLWVQTWNSLKVFGMCWRRLYRVPDSCILNTRFGPNSLIPNWWNSLFF